MNAALIAKQVEASMAALRHPGKCEICQDTADGFAVGFVFDGGRKSPAVVGSFRPAAHTSLQRFTSVAVASFLGGSPA